MDISRIPMAIVNRYALGFFERLLAPPFEQPLRHPPIFFLGAPRSGSTLAIQVITESLDVGFISNKHAIWYGAPVLAERFFKPALRRHSSDFSSTHGETVGEYSPSECGKWWYRFFRREPAYVQLSDVKLSKMRQFRRSLAALISEVNRPMVFKNLYASFRIQPIAFYVPEALYVVMSRDEVEVGHSILEARKSVMGSYEQWWAMEPPSLKELLRLPPHQQVIEQVRTINKIIEDDFIRCKVDPSRIFRLNYDEFCDNTHAIIDRLRLFFSSHGSPVQNRNEVPEYFPRRSEVRIDPELYERMVNYSSIAS